MPCSGPNRSTRTSRALEFLLLLILGLVPVLPFPFSPGLLGTEAPTLDVADPPQRLAFGILSLIGALIVSGRWVLQGGSLFIHEVDGALALLAGWAALSSSWSEDPEATRSALVTLGTVIAFYVFLRGTLARESPFQGAMRAILLAAGINVVFALGQIAGPVALLLSDRAPDAILIVLSRIHRMFAIGAASVATYAEEPIGLMGNRNHLAFFLVLVFPFAFHQLRGLLPELSSRWRLDQDSIARMRWTLFTTCILTGILLGGVTLLWTRCRGAWIAGILVMALEVLSRRRSDRKTRFGQTSSPGSARAWIFSCAALLVLSFLMMLAWRRTTVSSRLQAWDLALRAGARSPVLGRGLGSFSNIFQDLKREEYRGFLQPGHSLGPDGGNPSWRQSRFLRHMHNDLLQIFFELGFIGVALVTFILFSVRSSFCARDDSLIDFQEGPFRQTFLAGLVLALSGFPFQIVSLITVLTLSVAVLATRSRILFRLGPPTAVRLILIFMVLVVSGHVMARIQADWAAERCLVDGVKASRSGNSAPGVSSLETGLYWVPNHPHIHNELGKIAMFAGDLPGARRHFLQSLETYRASSAHINLGCVAAAAADIESALIHFTTAVEMDPGNFETHYRLGYALASKGSHREAIRAFQFALAINAQDPRPGWEVARNLLALGDLEGSLLRAETNMSLIQAIVGTGSLDQWSQIPTGLASVYLYAQRNLGLIKGVSVKLGRPEVGAAYSRVFEKLFAGAR